MRAPQRVAVLRRRNFPPNRDSRTCAKKRGGRFSPLSPYFADSRAARVQLRTKGEQMPPRRRNMTRGDHFDSSHAAPFLVRSGARAGRGKRRCVGHPHERLGASAFLRWSVLRRRKLHGYHDRLHDPEARALRATQVGSAFTRRLRWRWHGLGVQRDQFRPARNCQQLCLWTLRPHLQSRPRAAAGCFGPMHDWQRQLQQWRRGYPDRLLHDGRSRKVDGMDRQ